MPARPWLQAHYPKLLRACQPLRRRCRAHPACRSGPASLSAGAWPPVATGSSHSGWAAKSENGQVLSPKCSLVPPGASRCSCPLRAAARCVPSFCYLQALNACQQPAAASGGVTCAGCCRGSRCWRPTSGAVTVQLTAYASLTTPSTPSGKQLPCWHPLRPRAPHLQ